MNAVDYASDAVHTHLSTICRPQALNCMVQKLSLCLHIEGGERLGHFGQGKHFSTDRMHPDESQKAHFGG